MANRIKMPRQRLSFKKKGKKWRKENVDSADNKSFYNYSGTRQVVKKKVLNLNLYNGKLDVYDMQSSINPNDVSADFNSTSVPHHPIATPKIDLLVGEEANRRFDYSIVVASPDAISMKQEDRKKYLRKEVRQLLESNLSDKELESALQNLDRQMKYSYKDAREIRANRIVKHYFIEQNFARKFNDGFKDALITGEEIYQVDILHDEPVMNKLNNIRVYTVKSGLSSRVEDADIIIVEDYWNPGKIIDTFYDELKPADIDRISEGDVSSEGTSDDEKNANAIFLGDDSSSGKVIDDYIEVAQINGHQFNNYSDYDGNVRVLRVYWKSQKLIYKVKYYDDYGDVQYRFESEEYIIDEQAGEELTKQWVNEWWEGTKVGGDIYLKMRPKPAQFMRMDNPNATHCGIIGEIYNTNQETAVSLMDRMRPYQYLYNAIWDRLNKAIAKNMGRIMELDLAKVPNGWSVDKWMYFAVKNGIAVVDSFKEGAKGAATGTLAGNFNTSGRVIDVETGNYIQQHISLLEYIKGEMSEIAGVNPQRQGQVANRETVGGVERAVNQSSHITEWWFSKHEDVKLRVISAFIDVSKVAFKGKSKKMQYLLDDQSIALFDMDGDDFAESDYGVLATNSSRKLQLEQQIQSLAHAFMQNGGSFATVLDIWTADSMADMRHKIEQAEADIQTKAQEDSKRQQEMAQQALQAEVADKEADRAAAKYKVDTDNATKVLLAQIQNSVAGDNDVDDDGIADNVELIKHQDNLMLDMQKLNQDMTKHKDNIAVEREKISASKQKPKTK